VARQRALDTDSSAHDVLDRHPAPGIGVDHTRVTDDTLRKTIERERGDRVDDLFGGGTVDSLTRHARAQLRLDLGHEALAPLEAERAPQLLRLRRCEAGGHHRHLQELLLEERHAERATEDRLEARMRIRHGLAAAPASN